MKILKPDWRGTCFPYCLCLLLNIRYSTHAGIHVFILGCICVVLPKTEAYWPYVLKDLDQIENLISSLGIDATLYTETHFENCSVTAMRCFLLEWHVILHECKNDRIQEIVQNIIVQANGNLSSKWQNVTENNCKQCEELEEKNIVEFYKSFKTLVQFFHHKSN